MNGFIQSNISNWLEGLEIKDLNPMQEAVLKIAEGEKDIQLLAATGSGKTLAFLLGVLSKLDINKYRETQALIVVPTRELALQIEEVWRKMGVGLKITACYGGHKREIEENNLIEAPVLIVGTPGRLADHLRRGNIQTNTINTLVLDEYDKSVEWGFQEEIEEIVSKIEYINFVFLASATKAEEIPSFIPIKSLETLDFRVEKEESDKIIQILVEAEKKDKLEELVKLLSALGERRSIVFCNHKDVVERVSQNLKELKIPVASYHGSMQQFERELALFQFKSGTVNFLITTDLAARGLDIDYIRNIIHLNLPADAATYTHRNGRTARQERTGSIYIMQYKEEQLPDFIEVDKIWEWKESEKLKLPERSKWSTVYVPLGRKNKLSKGDFVGYFINRGGLKFEDIGLIEVKDFISYIAIRRSKVGYVLELVKKERIKNKKVKMQLVK